MNTGYIESTSTLYTAASLMLLNYKYVLNKAFEGHRWGVRPALSKVVMQEDFSSSSSPWLHLSQGPTTILPTFSEKMMRSHLRPSMRLEFKYNFSYNDLHLKPYFQLWNSTTHVLMELWAPQRSWVWAGFPKNSRNETMVLRKTSLIHLHELPLWIYSCWVN